METAIYYPYMTTPQSAWFTQVLLYWDNVATIVPSEYDHIDSPSMRELVQAGLLRRMSPDQALQGVDSSLFKSTFLESAKPWVSPEPPRFTEIHAGKMSYQLFSELQKMGLAQLPAFTDHRRQGFWYRVETKTANAYMAYLAGTMSGQSDGFTPVTDRTKHIAELAPSGGTQQQKLRALRYVAITKALPAPTGAVHPRDLAYFKDQHRDDLKRCRNYLDLQLMSLARADEGDDLSKYEFQLRLAALSEEAAELQAELQAKMIQRGWPAIARANFGAVAAVGLSSASTVLSGGSALMMGLALTAGAAAVIDPARELINKRLQPQSQAPLIYAALAAKL